MTTDPDATSVPADPSRAKNPPAPFAPWDVRVHGEPGNWWACIAEPDALRGVFATGETMAQIEERLIEGANLCAS